MLVANAVVDTDQPRLQVGENQMDDRQVLLGNLWITTLGNSEVLIAALTEASIAGLCLESGGNWFWRLSERVEFCGGQAARSRVSSAIS